MRSSSSRSGSCSTAEAVQLRQYSRPADYHISMSRMCPPQPSPCPHTAGTEAVQHAQHDVQRLDQVHSVPAWLEPEVVAFD